MLTRTHRGFTIIEMMIAIAIMSMLLALALPNFSIFLQNTQIKNAGESVLQGLNLARAEALRRNAAVRFQFVSDLTAACALATNSLAWVVSLADPTVRCDVAPSDTTAPQIVQKQSAREGTANVIIATTGGSVVTFGGLGRPSGAQMTQIDISNSSGTCEASGGTLRCMRVLISTGGQPRLCDPKVGAADDPRNCAV